MSLQTTAEGVRQEPDSRAHLPFALPLGPHPGHPVLPAAVRQSGELFLLPLFIPQSRIAAGH